MTMTITIKQEMDFEDLMDNCWCGAIDTLQRVEEEGKEEELMNHLEDIFFYSTPTMTELNDYLWFEDEIIFEALGIIDEEDEEEEEE